jgi:hypothetical protein
VIRVGGLTYWEIKCRALNGHRSKLSAEQLGFVGIRPDTGQPDQLTNHGSLAGWLQPTNPSNIDAQLEALERLRDVMPGWVRLARELVKDDES